MLGGLSALRSALHTGVVILMFLGREGLLLLTASIPLSILLGAGRGLGLPNLFWRVGPEDPARRRNTRLAVGTALGVLLATDVLILLLVESGATAMSAECFERRLRLLTAGVCGAVFVIALLRP